jgi:hypothetical protein
VSRCLVLAACLLGAGCSEPSGGGPGAPPDGGPAPAAEDSLDVYETVFRYRLQKYDAKVTAYLSVDGKDPPAELLTRLRKDWPNLKPTSEEPKEKGLSVYAKGLKWQQGEAVLKAGYWFPTKFAGEGYFADHHVVREKGKWVVEKLTNETMS